MSLAQDASVFVRIADLSAQALAQDGTVRTQEFLAACSEILPIVEPLGTSFALVRNDVGGNIDRLRARQAADPQKYALLFDIVLAEVAAGEQDGSSSATKGLLWLKRRGTVQASALRAPTSRTTTAPVPHMSSEKLRAMEFVVAMLQRLHDDQGVPLQQAASEAYYATLHQFHGWIVSAAFIVALKLCPSREAFFANIKLPPGADLMQQLQACLLAFGAVLATIHRFLVAHNLDDPTKV